MFGDEKSATLNFSFDAAQAQQGQHSLVPKDDKIPVGTVPLEQKTKSTTGTQPGNLLEAKSNPLDVLNARWTLNLQMPYLWSEGLWDSNFDLLNCLLVNVEKFQTAYDIRHCLVEWDRQWEGSSTIADMNQE